MGAIVMIFGLPMYGVTGASLYSKLLPPSIQGRHLLSRCAKTKDVEWYTCIIVRSL